MSPTIIAQNAPQLALQVPAQLGTPAIDHFGNRAAVVRAKAVLGFHRHRGFFAGHRRWEPNGWPTKNNGCAFWSQYWREWPARYWRLSCSDWRSQSADFSPEAISAMSLAARFSGGGDPHSQIWMIVGGIIGAIVAAMAMDWAIIVLSSLAGATAILSPFAPRMNDQVLTLVFLLITIAGIVIPERTNGCPRCAATSGYTTPAGSLKRYPV